MNLKDNLKKLFYDRSPNTLIFEHIKYEFPKEKVETIESLLNELEKEGFLQTKIYENNRYPAFKRKGYRISEEYLGKYPIQTEIEIGDIKIPRMIDGDVARAEDINVPILSFNKIVDEKIRELKEAYNNELRRILGTIISIFGLFFVLFSLVNIAIKPIFFSQELKLSWLATMFQTTCNIIPLVIVLCVFLIILNKIFK